MKKYVVYWVTRGGRDRSHLAHKFTYRFALCGAQRKSDVWKKSRKGINLACNKCIEVFEREKKFKFKEPNQERWDEVVKK